MTQNYNLDQEKSLIGSIIISNKNSLKIVQEIPHLKPSHFYHIKNQSLYEAIQDISNLGQSVDFFNIAKYLKEKKTDFTRQEYDDLIYNSTLIANYERAAEELIDLFKRREIEKQINGFGSTSTIDFVDKIQTIDQSIEVKRYEELFLSTNNLLAKYFENKSQKKSFFDLKITAFNKSQLRLPKTGLAVIAARSKVGKTTLALQIVKSLSKEAKTAFFSLEMQTDLILNKYLALPTETTKGVNPLAMTNNGELVNNTIDKHINQAIKELEDYPVDFCHARLTVDQILAQMRAGIRRGVSVFVIDQLSKISYSNYKLTQKQRYDEIVDKISNFAKSEEVLVILLSQCNREINGREEKTPRDSDVSDTDRLLQEADVLLVGAWKDPAVCANWLVVNRHGTSGHVEEIEWNKSLAIYDLSKVINKK